MSEIEIRIAQLASEFAQLEDEFLRYTYLVELGGLLPPMAPEEKTSEHLFSGCQSRVWLVMEARNGRFYLRDDSDTVVMSGLLYLFVNIYNGTALADAANSSFDPLRKIGLTGSFSSPRQSGINGIVTGIRAFCQNTQAKK